MAVERTEASRLFTFNMGDALPASERLSSWVTVVALVYNDAILDSMNIVRSENRPAEMAYFTRIAAGHVHEAAKFSAKTSDWPEVQELIAGLDADRHADWKTTVDLWDSPSPLSTAIRTARHHVFHYPNLHGKGKDEVEAALSRMSGDEGRIEGGETVASERLLFADELALNIVTHSQPGEAAGEYEPFVDGLLTHVLALQRWTRAALAAQFKGVGTIAPIEARQS